MFRVVEGSKEEVVYEVTSSIGVGRRYRISASQGYAGIINGVVEVVALISANYVEDATQEMVEMIESYKEIALDMHTDRNEVPYEPEYSEELRRLDDTVWVVYRYSYGEGIDEGLLVFPIEEFIDHTSLF